MAQEHLPGVQGQRGALGRAEQVLGSKKPHKCSHCPGLGVTASQNNLGDIEEKQGAGPRYYKRELEPLERVVETTCYYYYY